MLVYCVNVDARVKLTGYIFVPDHILEEDIEEFIEENLKDIDYAYEVIDYDSADFDYDYFGEICYE